MNKTKAAQTLGRAGGRSKSEAKIAAARENIAVARAARRNVWAGVRPIHVPPSVADPAVIATRMHGIPGRPGNMNGGAR